jgi:hypothetical protein
MASKRPYGVGFGKPPEQSRFVKGQSGNPSGRPKGSKNLATVLDRELRQRVVINENGQRKVITKLEAAVKQVVNKAAAGDLCALKQLHALVRSAEESASEQIPQNEILRGDDEKVMQGILKRLEAARKEGDNYRAEEK